MTVKFFSYAYDDDDDYDDYTCLYDTYGVGVKPDTCFRHGSYTAKLSCSSSGVTAIEYTNSDCSGTGTTTTIPTVFDTCNPASSWPSNSFFQDPPSGGGFIITCSEDQYWAANYTAYSISRTTHSLDSSSAIDYRQDTCGDDSCQSSPPITYAYTSQCLDQPESGVNLLYSTYTSSEMIVYFYDSSCFYYQDYKTIKYGKCVECTKFYNLADYYWTDDWIDSYNDAAKLAATIIIVIIVCVIIGCLCICAIPILLCGGGAAILACLCCKDKKNASAANATVAPMAPGVQMAYANSYPQNGYAPVAANPQQMSMNQGMELVTIQIPPSAPPGSLMTVMKSNGQAVQYQVPLNVPPGSQVQVYV